MITGVIPPINEVITLLLTGSRAHLVGNKPIFWGFSHDVEGGKVVPGIPPVKR